MTIAVFINNESDATSLLTWGREFAAADHCDLLVAVARHSTSKPTFESISLEDSTSSPLNSAVINILKTFDQERIVFKHHISTGDQENDLDRVAIDVRELSAPNPPAAFADQVESLNITLLLLPAHQPVRGRNDAANWSHQLFAQAPCETVLIRGNSPHHPGEIRLLIASDNENDQNTDAAMRRGCQLAESFVESSLTLLFVRPDDDWVAGQVAEKHLERLARQVPNPKIKLLKKVQLADSLIEGIMQQDLTEYDLVLVGTRHRRTLSQLFRQSEAFEKTITSVAVIRKAVPYSHQIWTRFQDLIRSQVPQLEREQRISVVDRLQNSSLFDFDFVALISLSTLIAALGLARNSGAVVIGAMLVAPLMTPLVAIGFSLVQGNEHLIRRAVKSVFLGFTVALGIGVIVGEMLHLFTPSLAITTEMYSRGAPNFLDLIVALASGVAGAYAMGRSHLVSAIPGVAIAAALVPPIATSGLALAMGDVILSGSALLLFVTNIIAIVLGTTITFWAIGIDNRQSNQKTAEGQRPRVQWPRYVFLGLVALSIFLAAEMNYYNPIGSQTPQTSSTTESSSDR